MQNEIKTFIKENACWIYEYINTEVLKDVGFINPNYFIKVIEDILIKEEDIELTNLNILPYFIFTLLPNKGRIDYTSLRNETINFNKINKEASTYYNYVKFTLNDEFIIELMQSKIGGMPIDADFVKFSKTISIKESGLTESINTNKNLPLKDEAKKIQEAINIL